MTAADLARILHVSRSLASLVLGGKRSITAGHARALGDGSNWSRDIFRRTENNTEENVRGSVIAAAFLVLLFFC